MRVRSNILEIRFHLFRYLPVVFQISLISTFLSSSQLHAQVYEQLYDEIDKIIRYETEISFEDVPGFCLGVVDGDSTFIYSFGSSGDSQDPIPDSAIFELGGLTKIFTGLLFNELESRHLIGRYTPVNDFLEDHEKNHLLDDLTIQHLLTHTSGLGTLPPNLGRNEKDHNNRYASYSKQDLIQYYHSLKKKPGKINKYIYSHINYGLLEILLERATKDTFEGLLEKYLCRPLQLNETGVVLDIDDHNRITRGHSRSGRKADLWLFKSFAGSEGIKSSPRDLCNFMRQMLKGDHALASSFENSLILHHKIPNTKKTYVGDAWHAFKNKRDPNIYLHTGKTGGHGASISFVRETKTAVVLMTNATAKMDGLALLVLRLINDNWKRKTN